MPFVKELGTTKTEYKISGFPKQGFHRYTDCEIQQRKGKLRDVYFIWFLTCANLEILQTIFQFIKCSKKDAFITYPSVT